MRAADLQRRFERMDWQQRLGNLASTLARLSTRAALPEHDGLVVEMLQEAALIIEWTATNTPPNALLQLAAMQREILAFKSAWPQDAMRPLLSLYARNHSDLLLQMAGLTDG